MQHCPQLWNDPLEFIQRERPDYPVACFSRDALEAQYDRFETGFPGLVTYAVKANPMKAVLETLARRGMPAFDVASLEEMRSVRAVSPNAALHYHNPVRSNAEIAVARRFGITSWSVDCAHELAKMAPKPGDGVAVRIALSVPGAAYDFGEKFGALPSDAIDLLRQVAAFGATPSLTFHPGTQCNEIGVWERYIDAAAQTAKQAGVTLARLNVGGGFASDRDGTQQDLTRVFDRIADAVRRYFPTPPKLVCEPGRAMVAEAFTLVTRIKAKHPSGMIFLNDGIYGGLAELRDMPMPNRFVVVDPSGRVRRGALVSGAVYGPTCDSVDRLPGEVAMPRDCEEGDYVLFPGMGAYSTALSTGFNGYGVSKVVTVMRGLAGAEEFFSKSSTENAA